MTATSLARLQRRSGFTPAKRRRFSQTPTGVELLLSLLLFVGTILAHTSGSRAASDAATRPATQPSGAPPGAAPAARVAARTFTISDIDDAERGLSVGFIDGDEKVRAASRGAAGIWRAPHLDAQLTSESRVGPDGTEISIHVRNGWTAELAGVTIQLPWVMTAPRPALRTYSAFRGGSELPWPLDGYAHQNSSTWPGYGYSPIAVFYDRETGEGVGVTAFDPTLRRTTLSWVSGPEARVAPAVQWNCALPRGEDAVLTIHTRWSTGMPDEHFRHYRERHLRPFMERMRIEEAAFPTTAPWCGASWPEGLWRTRRGLTHAAHSAKGLGAHGYIQWSWPDGKGYFDPHPPNMPWWGDLENASAVLPLGVLVNPFFSPRIRPKNDWIVHGSMPQDLRNPIVQNYLTKLCNDLRSRGVTCAFWDTGTEPQGFGHTWLQLLADWKEAGVTLLPETSCDLAAWATGGVLHYQWHDHDYRLARAVTPACTIFMLDQHQDGWWEQAEERGLIPMLTFAQLRTRWIQQGRPRHNTTQPAAPPDPAAAGPGSG